MVLIVSEKDDFSTQEVIEWLIYRKIEFIRLTPQDKVSVLEVEISIGQVDFLLEIDKKESGIKINLRYKDISFYWYRRGVINITNFEQFTIEQVVSDYNIGLINYLSHIRFNLVDFIYSMLGKLPNLGNIYFNRINKLSVLVLAQEAGLLIPYSFMSTSKNIFNFFKSDSEFVYKNFDNFPFKFEKSTGGIYSYTSKFENLSFNEEKFDITFFQDLIKKEYDIRTFYLDGKTYSTLIFSQNDTQTAIDFRKYNNDIPNRTIAYKLPLDIEEKLALLMKMLKLNSGSIDFVIDKNNQIYFLEVNPVGQFKQVDYPGRFNLPKVICDYIINERRKY